jgi:putative DNA primase/helicase
MGSKSGLVALDVDPRAGGDASISELIERHGELPRTLEASTGGGGTHVLFSHPGVTFKNSSSVLGEGLDVKTDGGYIVAAPSLHASGRRYSWSRRQRPAKPPRWLLELLTAEKPKAAPKAAPKRRQAAAGAGGPAIAEGARNDRLFRIACAMRGNGADVSEIEAELLRVNSLRCCPPLDGAEVRKVAASAAKYLPNGK